LHRYLDAAHPPLYVGGARPRHRAASRRRSGCRSAGDHLPKSPPIYRELCAEVGMTRSSDAWADHRG